MKTVTMHEAKTHLSQLVEQALAGEEIVIARRKDPLVRLVVVRKEGSKRKVGVLPGLVARMGEDFNAAMEDWGPGFPEPEAKKPAANALE